MRSQTQARRRSGNVVVLTLVFLVTVMAALALALDIGYLHVVKTEAQRSADAAALSAAWELVREGGAGNVDPTSVALASQDTASLYSGLNRTGGIAPALGAADAKIGQLTSIPNPTAAMDFAQPVHFNAVWVRIRRTKDQNSEVPTFFAKVLGVNGVPMQTYSTAAFVNNFAGFHAPSDGSNLQILPFALKKTTWDAMLAGGGSDDYRWNEDSKTIASGHDGVREINLFPQDTGASGNSGTVDIGSSNNSTNDIKRQILDGISPQDFDALASAGRTLELNDAGETLLEGDTGISAGVSAQLNAIKGQPRIIPIYREVAGPGNNAVYTIVEYAGVRIMDVDLTGAKNKNKKVVIQPANIVVVGGVPNNGATTSDYIFSPVRLIDWQPPTAWLK